MKLLHPVFNQVHRPVFHENHKFTLFVFWVIQKNKNHHICCWSVSFPLIGPPTTTVVAINVQEYFYHKRRKVCKTLAEWWEKPKSSIRLFWTDVKNFHYDDIDLRHFNEIHSTFLTFLQFQVAVSIFKNRKIYFT